MRGGDIMSFLGILEDIIFKVADSAAASAGRSIDRSVKNRNLTDDQRERIREKKEELQQIREDYKEHEKSKKYQQMDDYDE